MSTENKRIIERLSDDFQRSGAAAVVEQLPDFIKAVNETVEENDANEAALQHACDYITESSLTCPFTAPDISDIDGSNCKAVSCEDAEMSECWREYFLQKASE